MFIVAPLRQAIRHQKGTYNLINIQKLYFFYYTIKMSSKFLSNNGSGDISQLQDGTTSIFVKDARLDNLIPNFPVKSDFDKKLYSA